MQVPLEAILSIIRENLNDRYKRGFPIIKELIQNADDVGATRLDFGLVPGLPGAQHPLLRGAALVVVNDGPFTDDDARAINSIGLSSKPGDRAAVGKFGLGLKSLFHLCEAFFYCVSHHTGLRLVNPWAETVQGGADLDRYHPDWNSLATEDYEAVTAMLSPFLGSQQYVCLWIPLRKREHLEGHAAIMDYYPGDIGVETLDLFSRGQKGAFVLPGQLAAVMPLLESLQQVTAWELKSPPQPVRRVLSVSVRPTSIRRRPLNGLKTGTPLPLAGQMGIEGSGPGAATALFAGYELLLSTPAFAELKASEYWPRQSRMDLDSGAHRIVPHAAQPHCAVYFVRLPDQAPASLEIARAVFLPVDEPFKPVGVEGAIGYRLVLHGDYFVDAGRSRIEGWDAEPSTDAIIDTHSLREAWNSRLAKDGTLPLLLPALERFARETKLAANHLHALTLALRQTGLFTDLVYRRHVCRWHKWTYCVGSDRQGWQLLAADTQVLPIPKPPESASGRPFEVLPNLTYFPHLSFPSYPQLAISDQLTNWDEPRLLDVLDFPVEETFAAKVKLDYLVQFIGGAGLQPADAPRVVTRLQEIARQALSRVGPDALRAQASLVTQFMALIPGNCRCVIKLSDSQRKLDGIRPLLEAVLSCPIDGLIVPDEYDPAGAPATGRLHASDAARLLQVLADVELPSRATEDVEDVRTLLALQILGQTLQEQEVLKLSRSLPLFRARNVKSASAGPARLTMARLDELASRGLLFKFAPPPVPEGLARALQAALCDAEVYLIPANVAEAVESSISTCDPTACLRALAHFPKLAGSAERARLLGSLLPHADLRSSADVAALRYLLHEIPAEAGTRTPIYVDRHDVWSRVAVQALALWRRPWQMLNVELADQLNAVARAPLSVVEVARQPILDLLHPLSPEQLGHITGDQLAPADCEQLLRELDDPHLLRGLRIHAKTDGGYATLLAGPTYLPGPFQLDTQLLTSITLLRLVTDKVLVARYRELDVVTLDAAAGIEVVLNQPDPSAYWRTLLEAVGHLDGSGPLLPMLRQRLAATPWLPLRSGDFAKPEDLIYVPQLTDDIDRILATAPGQFISVYALVDELARHPAFPALVDLAIPPVDDAMTMLGEFMRQSEPYCIGPLGDSALNEPTLDTLVQIFAAGPGGALLPAAAVVAKVQTHVSPANALRLLRELRGHLPSRRLNPLLLFLSDQAVAMPVQRIAILSLFNLYLGVARGETDFEDVILPSIRLLSKSGHWKAASQLCYQVEGIDDADLLNEDQGHLLRLAPVGRPAEAASGQLAPAAGEPHTLPRATEQLLVDSAQRLAVFFQDWEGAIDRPIVGGFLSLLGDEPKIAKLAKAYLGTRDLAATREMIEWRPLDVEISRGKVGGFGQDALEAIGDQRYIIDVIEQKSETVTMRSLIGSEFQAHLLSEQSIRHLIVEDGRRLPPELQGPYQVNHLRLRRIQAARFTGEELSGLLRETARVILRTVYYQSAPNLDRFWEEELEKSDQLDIEIAQDWILESSFAYLPQLGLRTDPFFGKLLRRWEKARDRAIEAKHGQRLRPGHKFTRSEEVEQQGVQQELRAVFEVTSPENLAPRRRLVQAVRAKMAGEYQYRPQSVLFELFQNADDAVVEVGLMQGGGLSERQTRIVVGRDGDALFLAHWGRAINQVSLGNFDGSDLGYDADLRKMLMLQGSDKPGEPGVQLTGKFGLGFKTVFLLTEQPEVLSGRLGFEILGAVYPRRLAPEGFSRLRARLASLTAGPATEERGTLYYLCPISALEKDQTQAAFEEFESLAQLLVVFAKGLAQCDVAANGKPAHPYRWKPSYVMGMPDIEFGVLEPAQTKVGGQNALVLSAVNEKLLLLLGPRGFRRLDAGVPTIWVTVPTQERHGLGFAFNAALDVDAGRAQLARSSVHNQQLMRSMGSWLGDRLLALYGAAEEQWANLLQALELSADLEPYEFWESLWEVLAGTFPTEALDESGELIRQMLGAPRLGYARLAEDKAVIPTQLWGPYRRLTVLGGARYAASGKLNTEKVFERVAGWPQFVSRAPVGSIVSAQTGRTMTGIFRERDRLHNLTLTQVVRWEVSREAEVDPELAGRLGMLLTPDFLTTLDAGERDELADHLGTLLFRARSKGWQTARQLVIDSDAAADPDEQDELGRAGFAPDDVILSDVYSGSAVRFFRVCRGKLQASVERMVAWVFTAAEDGKRRAALRYFLTGEQGRKLVRALRVPDLRARFNGSWLNQLGDAPELLYEFSAGDRQQLLGLLEIEPSQLTVRPLAARAALRRIHAWWHRYHGELVEQYVRDTYPHGQPPALRADGESLDPASRLPWLTLFLLGAAHTVGRTQPQAHRTFLELCEQNGWAAVFADPQASAEQWMGVLDAYLDTQIDQDVSYQNWMRQFVSIYQLSRYLEVYREAYLSVPRFTRPFRLDQITNLPASAVFQGSGLTAPTLVRTLGPGACFVMRELVRQNVIVSEQAHAHCYVPVRRVRECFIALGCELDETATAENSPRIHAFLTQHLGAQDATFDNCFDLPFQAITRGGQTLREFLADL